MNLVQEEWRQVVGWEGMYEVSSYGRVKSSRRDLILAPIKKKSGYLTVNLKCNGRSEQLRIHRIVLTAFVCAMPSNIDGCHGNGIRSDNHLGNLRWDTRLGNQADRYLHGTILLGKDNPATKLSVHKVMIIRASTITYTRLASIFGVSKSCIKKIKDGRSWAHIN